MSAVPTSAGMPVPGPVQETTPTFVGMPKFPYAARSAPVSYTHLRAHETVLDLVCRLLLEKKKA